MVEDVFFHDQIDDLKLNDVERVEKTPVQLELEAAIAKAKEFHPVTKLYVDGYTGEVNRYKTPDNYVPDEGVVNDLPDLCHTEEHVTVAQIYSRLARMQALSVADGEYEFDERDINEDSLNEDTLSDFVDIQEDLGDSLDIESALVDKYSASESDAKSVERQKDVSSTAPSDAEEGATESA